MVAPSYAASGTEFSGSAANVDVAAPAGVVDRSIVVVVFFIDGATNQNVVAPAGWTAAEDSPVQALNHWLYVFWHRASGAETGPYSFTWDASTFREGQAHRYEGAVTSGSPFDAGADSAVDNANGSVTPAVSITTAGDDRLLIHAATCWAGGTWTPHTGFTKRQQPDVGLCTLSDKAQAAAGSSGSVTATTTTSDRRTAWLGALKPVNQVTGTGTAPLGALVSTATGIRQVIGSAAAALGGLTSAGAGTRTAFASAAAALGRLVSTAVQEGLVRTGGSGWYDLLSIGRERKQLAEKERARPPAACPNDGEPLETGPGEVLFCAFDGYMWRG